MVPARCYGVGVPRLFTIPFSLLTAAHFLASLGFASMLLLPLYLDWLGAGRAEIGAIMAAASVGGLLSRPLVGMGLDALGRKRTLIAGHALAVCGLAAVWLVSDMGAMTWTMRILFGIGEGAMFAGYFTFAADLIPEARRTEGIALFGVSGLLPLVVSPVSTLAGIHPPDLRWFLPLVGVVVAAAVLLLLPIPEPTGQPSAQPRARLSWRAALRALRERTLWPVWLATVTFAGMVGLFMAFATVVAQRRGVAFPTGMWLTYAGGAVMVRLLGARIQTGSVHRTWWCPRWEPTSWPCLSPRQRLAPRGFCSPGCWPGWAMATAFRSSPARSSAAPRRPTGAARCRCSPRCGDWPPWSSTRWPGPQRMPGATARCSPSPRSAPSS